MLDHTTFTPKIVDSSSALPTILPEPIVGITVYPDPPLHFISQFIQNAEFFSFLAKALHDTIWFSGYQSVPCQNKFSRQKSCNWLDKTVLGFYLKTRIFPVMGFAMEIRALLQFSFQIISSKTNNELVQMWKSFCHVEQMRIIPKSPAVDHTHQALTTCKKIRKN